MDTENILAQIALLRQSDYNGFRDVAARVLMSVDSSKQLGTALHSAVCRLSISNFFEPVMLRRVQDGNLEVHLLQRRDNDPLFPGMWYVGGNSERPNDLNIEDDAIARSVSLHGCEGFGSVQLLGTPLLRDERGPARARIHLVTPVGEPTNGRWFNVEELNNLEGGIVLAHQEIYIPMAVAAFEAKEGGR